MIRSFQEGFVGMYGVRGAGFKLRIIRVMIKITVQVLGTYLVVGYLVREKARKTCNLRSCGLRISRQPALTKKKRKITCACFCARHKQR